MAAMEAFCEVASRDDGLESEHNILIARDSWDYGVLSLLCQTLSLPSKHHGTGHWK